MSSVRGKTRQKSFVTRTASIFWCIICCLQFCVNGQSLQSNLDSFSYNLGSFEVNWKKETVQFEVVRQNYEEAVFSSPELSAFLAVGVGPKIPATTLQPGSYEVGRFVKCKTTSQSIDSVDRNSTHIVISGSLSSKAPSASVKYTFALINRSDGSLDFEFVWESKKDVGGKRKKCGGDYNTAFLMFASHPQEVFYGLGMQFSSFMHNGRIVPIISQEQGIFRGLQPFSTLLELTSPGASGDPFTTYSAIPHILSNYSRSLLIYDSPISVFDFTAMPPLDLPSACPSCEEDPIPRTTTLAGSSSEENFTTTNNSASVFASASGSTSTSTSTSTSSSSSSSTSSSASTSVEGEQCNGGNGGVDLQALLPLLASLGVNVSDPATVNSLAQYLANLQAQAAIVDEVIAFIVPHEENDSFLECDGGSVERSVSNQRALVQLNGEALLDSLGYECGQVDVEGEECQQGDTAFATTSPQVQVQVFLGDGVAQRVGGLLMQGGDYFSVIEEYTSYSGRMNPLPQWSYSQGAIISITGGTENVLQKYNFLVDAGVPIGALWIQDWPGLRVTSQGQRVWWDWQLDRQQYPDWEDLISQLQEDDVKVLLYANPYLANVGYRNVQISQPCGNPNSTVVVKGGLTYKIQKLPDDEISLYEEALQSGYILKSPSQNSPYILSSGSPDFTFGTLDFTNDDAGDWLAQKLADNMLGIGASGFMSDFGESLPLDTKMSNRQPSHFIHNMYPEMWSNISLKALGISGLQDGFFFSRSAGIKSPSVAPLFWLGDQMGSWDRYDGLKSVVTGLMSSGLSGLSLMHSDVGGYTMVDLQFGNLPIKFIRSKELLIRWAELNSISDAVLRTHISVLPDDAWQVWSDQQTAQEFGFLSGLHSCFSNYRFELMQLAQQRGFPLVRHPMLHYPENEQVQALMWQFMLGEHVMFCPVLDEGTQSVECYLPEANQWKPIWLLIAQDAQEEIDKYNSWLQTELGDQKSGWIDAPAPNLCPPVFFKDSQPQSLSAVLEYLQEQTQFSQTCLQSWQTIIA